MDNQLAERFEASLMVYRHIAATTLAIALASNPRRNELLAQIEKGSIAAWETSITAPGAAVKSQFFSHVGLHEMEQFFQDARQAVANYPGNTRA